MHANNPAHSIRSGSFRKFLYVFLAVLVMGFLAAPAASAHDFLVGTTPAEGQVIDTAPESVTITLSEVPLASSGMDLSRIQITGPDGGLMETEPVTLQEKVMSAPVSIEAPGVYSVAWRTVSSDGHPIDGAFEFTYEPATTTPSENPSPAAESFPAESGQPSETAQATPSPVQVGSAAELDSEETNSAGGIAYLPLIMIGVIVIGGATAFLLGRRQSIKANEGISDDEA